MLVWTDVAPELEREFDAWYDREHLPERVRGIPGYLCARRFVATAGAPRHLAVYEMRDAAVLHSQPYRALRLVRDAASRRLVPAFRNTVKLVADVVARAGEGQGGVAGLLPLRRPSRSCDGPVDDWVASLLTGDGVLAVRYAEANVHAEQAVRGDNPRSADRFLDAMLWIEAGSDRELAAALDRPLPTAVAACGLTPAGSTARFALRMGLQAPAEKRGPDAPASEAPTGRSRGEPPRPSR